MSAFVFDHVGLSVADIDLQSDFYGRALGLTEIEERVNLPEAHVRTAILRDESGLKIELIERGGSTLQEFSDAFDGAGTQGYFHWALYVGDLDAAFADMLGAGATSVSAPAPAARKGARFAFVKDPEGNLLELIQPPRGVEAHTVNGA
jgi:catechol 2,3-dioxygenase-like lactoylglutathione lyase family enzyme